MNRGGPPQETVCWGRNYPLSPANAGWNVLTFPQPQSRDWGYPMPPADAG